MDVCDGVATKTSHASLTGVRRGDSINTGVDVCYGVAVVDVCSGWSVGSVSACSFPVLA